MTTHRYREAGVDLDSAREAKRRVLEALKNARTPLAFGELGSFGGMIRIPDVRQPLLVTSTDGVGTKVLVAADAGRHDTVGQCLVNHCVNDILVHGARPLAFLDYIAAASIDPTVVASLVEGVARGCREHDMTLTGGETAEMPDLYHPGHYDLAGTIIGIVSEHDVLGQERVEAGDVLIGLQSNGLHTNGYTLARNIVFDQLGLEVSSEVPELGDTLGNVLLQVHRSYAGVLTPILGKLHAMAHITGGGIPGNLGRALPGGLMARVETGSWDIPPLFGFLEKSGHVSRDEMYEVFNMGIGMIVIAPKQEVDEVIAAAHGGGVDAWVVGDVRNGSGVSLS